MRRVLAVLVALAGLTLLPAGGADATYAGKDGRIAFVRANQIYTMTSTGTGVTKLTTSGKNYRPKFSPDGKRIAYVNETAAGVKSLWVMSATGGSKQAVTSTTGVTTPPAWSPNGSQLAFGQGGYLKLIKSTAPYGTAVTPLYSNDECFVESEPMKADRWLAWSASNVITAVSNDGCSTSNDYMLSYNPTTKVATIIGETGASCCANDEWSELFYGPTNQLGLTDRYFGYDEDHIENPPMTLKYPWGAGSTFPSVAGDTGGSPSPSGTYMALTNASAGVAEIFRTTVKGTQRRYLTQGYQPDWQRVS